jgi:hypothetical protein
MAAVILHTFYTYIRHHASASGHGHYTLGGPLNKLQLPRGSLIARGYLVPFTQLPGSLHVARTLPWGFPIPYSDF